MAFGSRRMTRYLLLAACTGLLVMTGAANAAGSGVHADDISWLNRVTYGLDTVTLSTFQKMGRQAYLHAQLNSPDDALPLQARKSIDGLLISQKNAVQLLAEAEAENRRINAMPDGDDKSKAKQALQEAQDRVAVEAAKRHLIRAVYSPAQIKEQMVWFWMNHFSVFRYKANLRWSVADYEETAIRPNAMGNFRDLLRATLRHPAMLVYLDNAQSSVNKINENYARELLELHTMGVNGGYTQMDVQELARILTGVGVNYSPTPPRLKPEWQALLVRDGAFEFNPARHDFGSKVLLNHQIAGQGWEEVEQALDLIVRQPATAHFVCQKLAVAFVADEAPPRLVDQMVQAFQKSQGDIPSVLKVMFESREFGASLGRKFKDPMHYLVSALRLAYDAQTREGQTFVNLKPANNMLNSLGEGLSGHLTPDGYGTREADWASAGQMSKRFEIAKWIGSSNAGLFDPDDGSPALLTGFPQLSGRLYFDAIEPGLSPLTRDALSKAAAQWEWNAYLLSSPDFMYH